MTPVLHYPLHERHNARGVSLSEARGADNASPQRARQGRPRQKSPSTGLPAAFPRKSSPGAVRPAAFPRKVRPTRLKTAFFGHFGLAGRTFSRSHPPSGHAGRTFSRTGHSHVATMQPMTLLQPLMQASVKPPSPLLAPEQQALKPTTPLQPKNALKTPISHPQRRWRFQLRLGPREQRRHRFQSAAE